MLILIEAKCPIKTGVENTFAYYDRCPDGVGAIKQLSTNRLRDSILSPRKSNEKCECAARVVRAGD